MKNTVKVQPILAKRITSIFLFVSILLTLICTIVSVRFIFPKMIEITLNKNRYIATAATNQMDDYLTSMINLINASIISKPFKDAVHTYEKAVNDKDATAAAVNLIMGTYVHNSGICRRLVLDDFENNYRFSSISAEHSVDESVFQNEAYEKIIENKKQKWTSPIFKKDDNDNYTMAYCTRISIGNKDYIATAFIDVTGFVQYIKEIEGSIFDDYAIYDSYGNLLLSGSNSGALPAYESNQNIYRYVTQLQDTRTDHYIYSFGNNNNAVFVGYTTNAILFQEFQSYFIVIVVLFLVIILLTNLIMLPVIRKKLLPLQHLSNAMQDISNGQIDSRIHLDTGDEIATLGNIYNHMLDTLQQNTDELIAREKAENKMKYSLLISQLDPHFLFNTMNIINSLARSNRTDEIIQVNTSLMNMLQDRLRISSTEITDTIEHEIAIVKEYLRIVQIRMDLDVEIVWNCPETLLNNQIPKNILQPIIENCFKHGLYDIKSGIVRGRINISFYQKNDHLYIEIEDNGVGFSEEFLDAFYNRIDSVNTRGRHIGLKNISDRLKYVNPDIEVPLKPENVQPHGAKITLTL